MSSGPGLSTRPGRRRVTSESPESSRPFLVQGFGLPGDRPESGVVPQGVEERIVLQDQIRIGVPSVCPESFAARGQADALDGPGLLAQEGINGDGDLTGRLGFVLHERQGLVLPSRERAEQRLVPEGFFRGAGSAPHFPDPLFGLGIFPQFEEAGRVIEGQAGVSAHARGFPQDAGRGSRLAHLAVAVGQHPLPYGEIAGLGLELQGPDIVRPGLPEEAEAPEEGADMKVDLGVVDSSS